MRILHAVKTVDGARWAVDQVRELVARGYDVHVALPALSGRLLRQWEETGATLHAQPMDLPVAVPWRLTFLLEQVRRLVDRVKPDLIHSHFFGTTLMLRMALGRDHAVPRVFQVPGPLHLEHAFFRRWELSSAGANDSWIASSRHVESLYRAAGSQRIGSSSATTATACSRRCRGKAACARIWASLRTASSSATSTTFTGRSGFSARRAG